MRPYGLPRWANYKYVDMFDAAFFGRPSKYRALKSSSKRRTRRIWKKKARTLEKQELNELNPVILQTCDCCGGAVAELEIIPTGEKLCHDCVDTGQAEYLFYNHEMMEFYEQEQRNIIQECKDAQFGDDYAHIEHEEEDWYIQNRFDGWEDF